MFSDDCQGKDEQYRVLFCEKMPSYDGHSEIIDTSFPNENQRFSHQLEIQLF